MLNSTYDADPDKYDALRACWLNERRYLYIHQWLSHRVACRRPLHVLELGSGTGWLLNRLALAFPDCTFTGVDPISSYVDYSRAAAHSHNVTFQVGSAETFQPFGTHRPVDILLSNDMLHHVTSLPAVVTNVTKHVAPGGEWLLIEPNCMNPYTFFKQATAPGERNFWPATFLRTAALAGWAVDRRDFLFLIPPFIRNPPRAAREMERRLEWIPCLAGGIAVALLNTSTISTEGNP